MAKKLNEEAEKELEEALSEETGKKLIDILSRSQIDSAAHKSFEIAQKPILKVKNSQVVAGIIGTTGFVLFAFGIENIIGTIPALASPITEVILGLVMLSVSGLLLKKLN